MNLNQIIQDCIKHRPEAERELFSHFAPKVLTICRRYASNDAEAQDFLQECFLCVFEKLQQYNPKKGEFAGWLYRVCTNNVLQILRKRKKELQLVYLDQLPDTAQINETDFDFLHPELVIHAIQQLPDGYREVLNLFLFEQWSHREIAEQLNISESTSRSQLTRAKKLLKTVLQKLMPNNYEKRLA